MPDTFFSALSAKTTLGFKLEATPYTAETLAAADFNVPAYNVSYDPDIQMYARKLARGDFSRDPSIPGKRSINIKFSVDIAWSGTAATAPTYFKCLQACAMKQSTFGSTGVSLVPNADYTRVPATIECVEKGEGASAAQVVVKAKGCMGNAKLSLNQVGQPVKIDFEFKGALVSITDRSFANILTPTGFDTALPEAVLNASISIFSEVQTVSKVSIDLGNDVQLYSDPADASGISGAHVVDSNPTMEIDPDLDLIANRGDWARWTGATTGAFSMAVGAHIVVSAPAAQYTKAYNPGDREGHRTNQKTIELKRSVGNDAVKILQGTEA